jgi:hypothetical protein
MTSIASTKQRQRAEPLDGVGGHRVILSWPAENRASQVRIRIFLCAVRKETIALRDKETLHRKVQELVDCFATTDPLKGMSDLKHEEGEEAPLKWLALAVLHGINGGAKEISVIRSADGQVKVLAEYRVAELPSPGPIIGERIVESLRGITHLEADKGETTLAVGIREGSMDLRVKIIKDHDGEKVTLKFPR